MSLNLNQLRVFYHTARNLSFTKAARELNITQPAITAQIKAFEEHCSFPLFKKMGRQIHLTQEGLDLYEYAHQIFQCEKEVETAIYDLRQLKRGILRVACATTYARYFMPSLITNYHRDYGEIKIQLREGSSRDMVKCLLDGRTDVAIIAKNHEQPELTFIPFSREELVLIAAPSHGWASRKMVSLQEVALEPLIIKSSGSGTHRQVMEAFARHQMTPNILMETNNADLIKQLLAKGEAVSFLSNAAILDDLKQKKLTRLKVKEEKIYLDVYIVHRSDFALPPPAKAFVNSLSELMVEGEDLPRIDELKKKIDLRTQPGQ